MVRAVACAVLRKMLMSIGVSIPVIIDTGVSYPCFASDELHSLRPQSSDLWVSAFVPNALVSDEPESVVYAIGKASGACLSSMLCAFIPNDHPQATSLRQTSPWVTLR
jgi:hypothetical protein